MRIHSLAHVLAAPFVVVTGIMLYLAFQNYNMTASYALLPLVIIIVLIYIFAPQINFWWNQRNPPVLDNEIVDWFEQFSPFYKKLDTAGKKRYLDRISIFMEGKEFFSMGSEKNEMPDDFKAIIAEQAIKLTFHREDYMFNKYERIACYKHPFPSPQYKFLHTVETEHEDGVILYSLEHALPGITRKDEYYNIVLHGFIEAFIKRNKNLRYPNIGQEHFPARGLPKITKYFSHSIGLIFRWIAQ